MSRQRFLAAMSGVSGVSGVFVVAAIAACASKNDHPGNPGLECNPTLPCHIGTPGGVTGNSPTDASVGDSGVADAGPNSLTLSNCEVHSGTSFTHDPKIDPLDTTDGLKVDVTVGGVVAEQDVVGGKFAIPVVDAKPDSFAWIEMISNTTPFNARVIAHVLHEGTTAVTLPGPTYFPMYAPDLRTTMATAVGALKPLAGTATVIVQLVDAGGITIGGATATVIGASTTCPATSPPNACGPYYDSGDTIVDRSSGTSTNGTIVFLGVDGPGSTRTAPNFIQVTVTVLGKPATPLPPMAMVTDAYSFVRATIK